MSTRLERDAHQLVRGLPGRSIHLGAHREGSRTAGRGIIVREVVDQLFDADRIFRRQPAFLDEAPHVGVRCAIDIDGERRERIRSRRQEGILLDRGVGFRVEIARVGAAAELLRHRASASAALPGIRKHARCRRDFA